MIIPIAEAALEFKQQLEQDWLFTVDTDAIFGLLAAASLNCQGSDRPIYELMEWLFSEGLEIKTGTTHLQRQFVSEVIEATARTIQEELFKIGFFSDDYNQYEFIRLMPDSRFIVVKKT